MASLHRDAGCKGWSVEGGYEVPDDYGDPGAEVEALNNRAVLYDASAWGRVEMLGVDARQLLNGFCTVDVTALAAGDIAYGLITGAKGQVLADLSIAGHEDRLWLRLPPGQGRPMRDHLGKYVIAEDVELLPMGDLLPLWLLGRRAVECLVDGGVEVPSPGRHRRADLWGSEAQVESGSLLGLPGVCLSVSASIAGPFAGEVTERLSVDWAGRKALESARIAAGVPRWGVDFGPETLPQEAGLNAAVDYEKGCYLGQEIVARLHYRGRAQRHLCAVEVEGPVDAGARVVADGVKVGRLTSLDPLPSAGGCVSGIGMLKRAVAEPGTRLAAGSRSLTVIRLLAVDSSGVPAAVAG